MADETKKNDDGRGIPASGQGTTAAVRPADPRTIPGGRFDTPAIGVNAFDREDLPSFGKEYREDFTQNPENPD